MPLPSKRDPGELRSALQQWIGSRLPGARVGPLSVPDGNGFSSETLLFDVDHDGGSERLVARMRPDMDDFPVFPTYDLALQARAMELVAAAGAAPVPAVRWTEWDEAVLGSPFFVMDRIDGRAPPDMPPYVFGGWLADLTPADRGLLQRRAVEVQAALHSIDLTGADTSWLVPTRHVAERPDHLDRLLDEQRDYYDWADRGRVYWTIERAFAWLEQHRPSPVHRAGLNWGDARPGNILFGGADGLTPVAVLDWEMANLGPPEVDVAWMVVIHAFFQSIAERFGLPGLPDFSRREDVIREYEAASGRRLDSFEWYEVYAATRFAIVSLRTSARAIAYGTMPAPDEPEDLIMHRAMLDAMMDGSYWRAATGDR